MGEEPEAVGLFIFSKYLVSVLKLFIFKINFYNTDKLKNTHSILENNLLLDRTRLIIKFAFCNDIL